MPNWEAFFLCYMQSELWKGRGRSLSTFEFGEEGWAEPAGKNTQDSQSETDMVMNFRPHQLQLGEFG